MLLYLLIEYAVDRWQWLLGAFVYATLSKNSMYNDYKGVAFRNICVYVRKGTWGRGRLCGKTGDLTGRTIIQSPYSSLTQPPHPSPHTSPLTRTGTGHVTTQPIVRFSSQDRTHHTTNRPLALPLSPLNDPRGPHKPLL